MEIKIYKSDKRCIVDDDMFDFLNKKRWHIVNKGGYVARWTGNPSKRVYMHREVLAPPPGMQIDHINGNKLDNRKCNLRVCTCVQNLVNRGPNKRNKSGFKGVYIHGRKWAARIDVNGKGIYIGVFSDINDAARAYDLFATRYYGEFAFLNFGRSLPLASQPAAETGRAE